MSTSDDNLYRGDAPGAAARRLRSAARVRPARLRPAAGLRRRPATAPARLRPPPGYPAAYGRPTNTMAILALVLAFVFAPAGLVLGIIARKQIRQTGEDGAGLALAGIIVGGIATALFVLIIVFWIIACSLDARPDGSFGT